MKYLLILAISIAIAISCNNESHSDKPSKDTFKQDTSMTMAVFVSIDGERIQSDAIFLLEKDTVAVDTTDILRNIAVKEKLYFAPGERFFVDSLNKPVLDSAGNPRKAFGYFPIAKEMVWDLGVKFDSVKVAALRKYLKPKRDKFANGVTTTN
jgi:hypothetical protein